MNNESAQNETSVSIHGNPRTAHVRVGTSNAFVVAVADRLGAEPEGDTFALVESCLSALNGNRIGWSLDVSADSKAAFVTELMHGLRQLAELVLPHRLAGHAKRHQLSYRRVTIRAQRTLWGSYSSSGTLSLNYKLLFLSRELLDYVLLHELAHTVHLNHSQAFWRLLDTLKPAAGDWDERLQHAGKDVPPWLELAN